LSHCQESVPAEVSPVSSFIPVKRCSLPTYLCHRESNVGP
jgi:hypothetical protein